MAKKVIHINKHILAHNLKTGSHDPVVTARYKHHKKPTKKQRVTLFRGDRIHITDGVNVLATVICDIDHPLSCGARCYIETPLTVIDADNPEMRLD